MGCQMINIRLGKELEKDLTTLSKETNLSKNDYIKIALKEFLRDRSDSLLAEKELKEFYDGDQTTFSLDEIRERNHLE